MERPTVHIQAYAKVNLSLTVHPPLPGGMHPITSQMVRIALCDDLEVIRLDDHALSRYAIVWHNDAPRHTEIDWPVTTDLAVRAHRLLEVKAGHPLPVQMKLEKRIPVGGGLGGGSADAAAMLKATTELFNLNLDLSEIALDLGSDVPYLLHGGAANVQGVGEVVEPVQLETMYLVIIIPEYSCSTDLVYKAFDQSSASESSEHQNDLLIPACIVETRLGTDLESLRAITEQKMHLSGSGSTMFAICDNAEHAVTLAKKIEEHTELVAIATQTRT